MSTFTRPQREGSTFVYDRDEASTKVIARPWSYQNKPPSFWALQSIDTCILHNAIYIDLDSLHVNSTVVNQSVVILCPKFCFLFHPPLPLMFYGSFLSVQVINQERCDVLFLAPAYCGIIYLVWFISFQVQGFFSHHGCFLYWSL